MVRYLLDGIWLDIYLMEYHIYIYSPDGLC